MSDEGSSGEAPAEGDASGGKAQAEAVTKRAVRGAFWTVAAGLSSRVIGLVGTITITRFLDPEVYGDATLAAVVVQTAAVASSCGVSQYIVSKPKEGKQAVFHATFFYIALGFLALCVPVLFRHKVGDLIHTPGIARFIPFLALATFLDRFTTLQDVIQVRSMNFRLVALQRSAGEIVYAVTCVGLAWLWQDTRWVGYALVGGALGRSIVRLVAITLATSRKEWLEPCRITWERTKALFSFGLPMSLAALANVGSRRWDNVLIARHFGGSTQGIYNLAYNLADLPATQLGETIGDVLVPSFAQIENDEERKKAFLLSTRIMVLIVAPLAVGLAMISRALVYTLFTDRWSKHAGSFLLILAGLSVVRPLGWVGNSFLQVKNRPRIIMLLEWSKTLSLLAFMVVLERISVYWACAAVGIAFGLNSFAYAAVIRRLDGISLREQLLQLARPLLACAPMALAIYFMEAPVYRFIATPLAQVFVDPAIAVNTFNKTRAGMTMGVEVVVGALIFVASALTIAPGASRDLIGLVRDARRRRAARAAS
ncbi:MAG: oligosaccharide flippase family protein [Byssovorax sp.]